MSVPGHHPYAPVLWVRNPDVMTRSGAFGVLVMTPDGDRPLLLEGTGVDLWQALSEPKSDAQLVADLADHYGVEVTVVEPDVRVGVGSVARRDDRRAGPAMTPSITLGAACGLGLSEPATLPQLPVGGAWDAFFGHAVDERAVPILANAVAGGLVDATVAQREQLVTAHEAVMRSCLYLEQSTLAVAGALRDADLDYRLLKGPAVARLDYPDPSWRAFGDIDVLVRSSEYEAALHALTSRGGRRRSAEIRPGFDRRFGKGVCIVMPDGVQVDVHRTLASGPFGLTILLDGSLRRWGHRDVRRRDPSRAQPRAPLGPRLRSCRVGRCVPAFGGAPRHRADPARRPASTSTRRGRRASVGG